MNTPSIVVLPRSDQMRQSRRGQQSILGNDQFPDSIGGGNFNDHIDHLRTQKSTITSDHQYRAGFFAPQTSVQNALNEVFGVVVLLEFRNLEIFDDEIGKFG